MSFHQKKILPAKFSSLYNITKVCTDATVLPLFSPVGIVTFTFSVRTLRGARTATGVRRAA